MAYDVQQHLTTKAHPAGWTFVLIDDALAGLAGSAHTACAQLDLFNLVAASNGNSLDIWIEAPAGMPLTKADSIPERRPFATFSAFRHEKPDLLGFSHNQYGNIAYRGPSRKHDGRWTGHL
jgi:hypothetical protein